MRYTKNSLIVFLIVVILFLFGVIAYIFGVKPAINNYVIEKQTQGMDYALAIIVQQIQQNGFVKIPIGNQTLILVPAQPQTINSTKSSLDLSENNLT